MGSNEKELEMLNLIINGAKANKDRKEDVHLINVIRHGKQIVIPEELTLKDAIIVLERRIRYEDEKVELKEHFNCFVWDGALALHKAMEEVYGFVNAETIPGMFGDQRPEMISVETDFEQKQLVPWGRFSLPGIEGHIETGLTRKEDRIIFVVHAMVKRRHEKAVKDLFERTQKIIDTDSIYQGKAFRLRFKDNDGDNLSMPQPSFLDLRHVKEDELIYSEDIERSIATNIFTPIEKSQKCRDNKIPLKRGILLSGPYGTGKTLAAYITAAKSRKNGWTFLYCERANELGDMVRFAKHYQPAVIFCEDVDRVTDGERDVEMDEILNVVDGIESKSSEIMIILTTNHVENITKAMLRPGRLDAVIPILPPDSKAVERLIRLYSRGLVQESENLERVGKLLENQIPAVIRECVERAKLAAIKICTNGHALIVNSEALEDAATTMKNQLDLLNKKDESMTNTERLGSTFKELMRETVDEGLKDVKVTDD